jgi:diguanylate cyclase
MPMPYQRFSLREMRDSTENNASAPFWLAQNLWALMLTSMLLAVAVFTPIAHANQGVAPDSLKITETSKVMSVWSKTRILFDPDRSMSVEQAIAALPKFEKPDAPYSTLGVRREAAWLHIPIETSLGAPEDWVADIDYPPLNYVDMYLLRDGKIIQKAELGSLRPFASRPLLARSHAMPIELDPASRYDLLVRIDTRGAMILPFTIETPAEFHSTGVREQVLQGLLLGVALCLVLYSLGQYASTRERLFVKYALLVFGSMSFTLLQLGIGAQYVWRDMFWIERHIAGISSMIAIGGTFLFLEEALREDDRTTQKRSWFELIMKGGAALAGFIAVLHALDVISLRAMSIIVTVMGPLPSTLATPKIIQQARRGNPVGWYLLLAFTIYMVSVVIITAVIRGKLPVNFWTLHSFQFGATFDMLAFLYVLTLRTKAIRLAAQHASRERDIMRALAHTDPLTGLANRRSLSDALSAALSRCSEENLLAVYVIDLDNFKPVNDDYGHDVGDELLVVAAKRFQANVRSGDIVSRLGGDEFVVLASGLRNAQQAEELGRGLLSTFDEPVTLGERRVKIGLTVGCAIAPMHGKDSMSILKLADDAMYAGKQAGKARLTLAGNVGASAPSPSAKAAAACILIMAAPLIALLMSA